MSRLRDDRRRQTEAAIIDSATDLFLQNGYARTSIADVAEHANVAERTIYVRFETKAHLFQRVVEAATVGDTEDIPLPDRDWSRISMTAATLGARIDAFADGVTAMHERLGPLMAVNGEVESSEPIVQESAGAARAATLVFLRAFWESAARDQLLPESADVEWLITTSTILSAAETRLLITRTLGWERTTFHHWLVCTWWRLISGSVSPIPPIDG